MKRKRLRPWNHLRWSEIISALVGPKLSALELILSSLITQQRFHECVIKTFDLVRGLNERDALKKQQPPFPSVRKTPDVQGNLALPSSTSS